MNVALLEHSFLNLPLVLFLYFLLSYLHTSKTHGTTTNARNAQDHKQHKRIQMVCLSLTFLSCPSPAFLPYSHAPFLILDARHTSKVKRTQHAQDHNNTQVNAPSLFSQKHTHTHSHALTRTRTSE